MGRSKGHRDARAQRAQPQAEVEAEHELDIQRLSDAYVELQGAIHRAMQARDFDTAVDKMLRLARLYNALGRANDALDVLNDAFGLYKALPATVRGRLATSFAAGRMTRVECLETVGRVEEAVVECRALLDEQDGASPELRFQCRLHLASLLMDLKLYDEMLDAVAPAVTSSARNDPFKHSKCLKWEGLALTNLGRHHEAVERLREVQSLLKDATDLPSVQLATECRFTLATALFDVERYEEALAIYDDLMLEDASGLMTEDDFLPFVRMQRRQCLECMGRAEEDEDDSVQKDNHILMMYASDQNSCSPRDQYLVACILFNRQLYAEAVAVFDRMLSQESEPSRRALLLYHKGSMLLQERPAEAYDVLSEALHGLRSAHVADACRRMMHDARPDLAPPQPNPVAGAEAVAELECQVCMNAKPAPRPAWCGCPDDLVCAQCWNVMQNKKMRGCPFCTLAPTGL